MRPAQLPGYAVHWAAGESFPLIVAARASVAEGVSVEGLGPEDYARLDFYEGGFDYDRGGLLSKSGRWRTGRRGGGNHGVRSG